MEENNELKMMFTMIIFLLGFGASAASFFPAVNMVVGEANYEVLGLWAIFGVKSDFTFNFNIFLLLGYLFTLGGTILSIAIFKNHKEKMYFLTSGLFLIALVINCLTVVFFKLVNPTLVESASSITIAYGPIIAIVVLACCIFISLSLAIKACKKQVKKEQKFNEFK